ncbi:hypothetical protein FDP41_011114 [Naegleria fowleri]|uniref:EF-hand domain-containing protein n=1 Tax=Naegleria fowleri TaxID=5763 RepID=A0A6A5C5U8_NAEFO|nr:uncharacterized protein FDP41_011114 [Naegleria fowleri]KAF0983136.1 hypothetical protein FDP41_011114 [Naegleria fowleri]CAG4712411.1 unnamed protein product [Naegleria fowleri]
MLKNVQFSFSNNNNNNTPLRSNRREGSKSKLTPSSKSNISTFSPLNNSHSSLNQSFSTLDDSPVSAILPNAPSSDVFPEPSTTMNTNHPYSSSHHNLSSSRRRSQSMLTSSSNVGGSTFLTECEIAPSVSNLHSVNSSSNLLGVVDINQITYNKQILSIVDVKEIVNVFNRYVKRDSRKMELWDLRKVLKELETPFNEDELFDYVQKLQSDEYVTIQELVNLIENQKKQDRPVHDNETVSAFVAMGGNFDRTGVISTEKLKGAVMEFGFTVDIEGIIRDVDDDGNGTVDFDEFCQMINMKGAEEELDDDEDEEKEEDIIIDDSTPQLTTPSPINEEKGEEV